jgi:molybdenum cofactor cytidylyltransferase
MNLSKALDFTRGDVIALIGGGGKTTTMFRLAAELANDPAAKLRVLTTTSTRIFAAQIKHSPAHLTFNPERQGIADILSPLQAALDEHGQVLLVGQADLQSGKAFGLPSETVDALAASGRFDLIINEADGSRMRPFKAPAEHEPVIPTSTTLVIPVVGLDILNQPLNDDTVHRANRVSQLSGTGLGQPITAETIVAVLGHPEGGLKNVPSQARVIPLLNKVEDPTRRAAAQAIAARLLDCERIDSVIIGAVQARAEPVLEVHRRTAAIVLAAGGSSRFGSPKQVARWGDQTFIERVVDTALASPARPVIVVLGAEVSQSRAALGQRPVEVVVNEVWAGGQSTSMQAGLAALPSNIGSALFMLVDLPGVTPDVVEAVIQRHRETLAPIVWPEFQGKRGHPVLFDRTLFSELNRVSGDTGGRPVLLAYQDRTERVAVESEGVLLDFDRPEDLATKITKEQGNKGAR